MLGWHALAICDRTTATVKAVRSETHGAVALNGSSGRVRRRVQQMLRSWSRDLSERGDDRM